MHSLRIAMLVLLGIGAVGAVDLATGIEVRIFPLYFFPLVLASWHFGAAGASVTSVLAASVWAASMFYGGRVYSRDVIWILNFATQTTAFLVVALLVARLRTALQHEQMLSRTDALTGLANGRSFAERAEASLALCRRNDRPVALAYLDLDNFKRVNDTLGHQQGDVLLREVAATFRRCLRASDIAARIGGDEFVIFLPETNAEECATVLEKIRELLDTSANFRPAGVTVSIGAVTCTPPPESLENAIKAADDLMYRVKTQGKNGVQIERLA